MDYSAVLQEVDTWPVEQRLKLMDAVWDSLDSIAVTPELTDAQRRELERRIADADAHPETGIPWEDVKVRLQQPR